MITNGNSSFNDDNSVESQIEKLLDSYNNNGGNNGDYSNNNYWSDASGNPILLSYAVIMKARSLINLRIQINSLRNWLSFIITITITFGITFYLNIENYIPNFSTSSFDSLFPSISYIDITIIIVLTMAFIVLYYSVSRVSSLQSRYNNIRVDLINHIGIHLCYCNGSCSCRDTFIRVMERRGIDLIFR